MDMLPLHPKLVHLPIALALLMPLVSGGLLVAWVRDLLPRRAWVVAVLLQALLVVSSVVAMRSGQGDSERVEKVVSESAIDSHEDAAKAFTWAAGGVLVLFLAGTVLPTASAARGAATAATAASLVVLFLGYRVGQAGGALVYQHGAASAFRSGMASPSGGEGAWDGGDGGRNGSARATERQDESGGDGDDD